MTSEAGDWLGEGLSYSFPAEAMVIEASNAGVGFNAVSLDAEAGDSWRIEFEAPRGALLEPGRYPNTGDHADESHPGLQIGGAGRGCGNSRGSFVVHEVEYGPPLSGTVHSLRATFEYHCEGAAPAMRGEVDVVGSRAPARMKVDVTLDSERSSLGEDRQTVELVGTVTCSEPVEATIVAHLGMTKDQILTWPGQVVPNCTSTPTTWQTTSFLTYPVEPLYAWIRAEAIDSRYTEHFGTTVHSRDEIKRATVPIATQATADAASEDDAAASPRDWPLDWVLAVVVGVVAAAGWSLLLVRRVRRRLG
jgi:hypothetical protein